MKIKKQRKWRKKRKKDKDSDESFAAEQEIDISEYDDSNKCDALMKYNLKWIYWHQFLIWIDYFNKIWFNFYR